MRKVNLNLYTIFRIVANGKSYSEASPKLGISTIAISKSIVKLETHLDKKLFYRSNKGIQLTEEGKGLYERISPALDILEAEENMKCNESIKIGSYSHIFSSYLTEKIQNVNSDNPNLKISYISNMRRKELVESLLKNEVNFIIDNNENEITNQKIEKQKLEELDNILIFHRPLKIQDIKDLENFKYILDSKSSTDKKLIELLEKYGVSIHTDIDMNATETKINFAKEGLGIAHVIKAAAKKELENKEVFEVDIPIELPKSPIVLLYLAGNLRKIDKNFIKKYL